MNKTTILAAASVLAATGTLFAAGAEAGGRHGGFHGGFRHHFHFRAPVYTYAQRDEDEYYYRVRRNKAAAARAEEKEKAPIVKLADGQGRQFDPASKVWFDGKSQCWSGKQAFAFKGGSWFYGSNPWRQVGGSWQTSASDTPAPVACDTVAAFASKVKTAAATQPAKETAKVSNAPAQADTSVKTASKTVESTEKASIPAASVTASTAKATECKKYFPSVGEMVSVPCGE